MSERLTYVARPQPTHPCAFCVSQRRYIQHHIIDVRHKPIRSAKTGLGSTLGTDWSMTTFDGRSDDQSFDSSRLQTIDETSEVAYFHPFKPLEYLDYDALEYVQNAWIHDTPHESFARKLVKKIRSALADISKKARQIWHLLSSI